MPLKPYWVLVLKLLPGPSVENQQDVLYKGKYMAAVRLWKKQNEEKKVKGF